jgi:heptosyltransferase-2
MKILLIQIKMLGDVLTSTIILDALRAAYPQAQLHYLINPKSEAIVRKHPAIDQLHYFDDKAGNLLKNFSTLANELRKEQFDVVIDVYSKWSTALLSKYTAAPIRIGQYKPYLAWLYSHTRSNQSQRLSALPLAYSNRLQLLEPLEVKSPFQVQPKIYISSEEKQAMTTICKDAGVDFDTYDYVMVNLFGSNPYKTYPPKYLAALLDAAVAANPKLRFLLNYFPKQQPEVTAFIALCHTDTRSKINLLYRADLREFIVLCSFCSAVVGNEGGAIHIGSALGLPTLAIFSPWITRDAWGLEAKNNPHLSLHFKDFRPELFKGKTKKLLQKQAAKLYETFVPEYLSKKFVTFLNRL